LVSPVILPNETLQLARHLVIGVIVKLHGFYLYSQIDKTSKQKPIYVLHGVLTRSALTPFPVEALSPNISLVLFLPFVCWNNAWKMGEIAWSFFWGEIMVLADFRGWPSDLVLANK
jgi:hypothetical protein